MSDKTYPMPADIAESFPVLVLASALEGEDNAVWRSARQIGDHLREMGMDIVRASSLADGEAAFSASPAFSCIALSWGLCTEAMDETHAFLRLVQRRTRGLPILVMMSKANRSQVPLEIMECIDGFIWLPEDSAAFIAGRIHAAATRYLDSVLPPFFGAMVNFDDTHEYSWHTPGHTGGTAFMKTPVGQAFLRFYGEQMLRSDLSISVGETGSQ